MCAVRRRATTTRSSSVPGVTQFSTARRYGSCKSHLDLNNQESAGSRVAWVRHACACSHPRDPSHLLQACQKMAWPQHKQVCIDPVEREAVARRGPAARPVDPRGIATPNQPNRPNNAKGGHQDDEPPPLRAMDVSSNATAAPTSQSPALVCGVAGASTSSNPPRKKRPPRDPAVIAARAADTKAAAEASAAAAAVSPPPPPFAPKQKPEGAWKVISEGDGDAICGVCNEKIFAAVELRCGHQYCKACVLSLKRYDILDGACGRSCKMFMIIVPPLDLSTSPLRLPMFLPCYMHSDELCAECRTAVPMPGMPDDLFDRGVRIVMVVQRRVELRKSGSWQNLSPELQAQMDMVRWFKLVSRMCARTTSSLTRTH